MNSTLVTPRSEWTAAPGPLAVWDVVLRDGTEGHVRALRTEDRVRVADFVARLSPRSLHQRFFAAIRPEIAIDQLTAPGAREDRLLLGLFVGPGDGVRLVGHAVYDRDGALCETAEVAFVVDDAFQGRGVATTLLTCLASAAEERGISQFRAAVLPENLDMLEVFRGSGFPVEEVHLGGVVHVRTSTAQGPPGERAAPAEVRAFPRCRVGARRAPAPGPNPTP